MQASQQTAIDLAQQRQALGEPHVGCNTPPQNGPPARFPMPQRHRDAKSVPASRKGLCELCGSPLENRRAKFCKDRWGFSCKREFEYLTSITGRAILARLLVIRRRRPRRRGEPVDATSKRLAREIRQLADEFDQRLRAGAQDLAKRPSI